MAGHGRARIITRWARLARGWGPSSSKGMAGREELLGCQGVASGASFHGRRYTGVVTRASSNRVAHLTSSALRGATALRRCGRLGSICELWRVIGPIASACYFWGATEVFSRRCRKRRQRRKNLANRSVRAPHEPRESRASPSSARTRRAAAGSGAEPREGAPILRRTLGDRPRPGTPHVPVVTDVGARTSSQVVISRASSNRVAHLTSSALRGATALRLCGRLGVFCDRRLVIGPIVSACCFFWS